MVSCRYYPAVDSRARQGQELVDLALQVSRFVHGAATRTGLTPAQWMALRYLARANRFSRSVSAFADFHGTTRGTASQTIKSLVRRGYLRCARSERDGRSVRFDLTPAARRLLARDPVEAVAGIAAEQPRGLQGEALEALRGLVARLALSRHQPVAGCCRLCGHLVTAGDGTAECRLLCEPLAVSELEETCIRFVPGPRPATLRR